MSENSDGPHSSRREPSSGTLHIARQAARDGASDAREAAERTWSALSLFACRLVYTTCYTVSYGVVFPSVLLARSIPKENAAVRGFVDGAHAARVAVNQHYGDAPQIAVAGTTSSLAPA